MSYCSSCGAKVAEGENFCSACGSKVTSPPKVIEEKAKSESGEQRSIERQRDYIQEEPKQARNNEPQTTVVSVSVGSRPVLGLISLCVGLGMLAGAICFAIWGEFPKISGQVYALFFFLGGLVAGIALIQGMRWLFKK
jgi:hypothetical protein